MGKKNGKHHKNKPSVAPAQKLVPSHYGSIGFLILAGLLWHGALLTNDGTYWDSWFVQNWLLEKKWGELHEFFSSVGMPVYGWLYAPFAFSPDIVATFMFTTVSCLIAQAILTYYLAIKLGRLNSGEAICLALLAQAMPIFTAGQDYIMFFFVFMHMVFLLAAVTSVQALELSGWRHIVLRTAGVLLFFISFYNAALLVFYGGFFLLLFLKWRCSNKDPFWGGAVKFSFTHIDLLFLPPVAWILRNKLTPQFGWYETYNSPSENIPFIIPSLQSFFANALPYHAEQLEEWITSHPEIFVLLIISVGIAALLGPKSWAVTRSKPGLLSLLGFGLLLLFFAIFPFAAAGKGFSPRPIGEPSRYTILTGLPLAIIIFGFLRILLTPKLGTSSRWLAPICVGLAIILGCQIPPVYLAERAEWIFSRSILHNAVKNEDIRNSSVIVLQNCGMSSEIVYGIYSFASAFGNFTRLVTPTIPQNRQYFTASEIEMTLYRTTMLPNSLNQVNPSGQQILLTVERHLNESSALDLCIKYLLIKYFKDCGEMDKFLTELTSLQINLLKPASQYKLKDNDLNTINSSNANNINSIGIELVNIKNNLSVAKTEVTQSQYEKIMGFNPSLFKDKHRPVERVSWFDAVDFCKRLTIAEKANGKIPSGFAYRLPSLKELEMLSENTPYDQAILANNTLYWQTQPVGSSKLNNFGLYDIIGNVWEWTSDSYDPDDRMKLSFGGSFANFPVELQLHPQRHETMDFFTRMIVRRLFGPTRPDNPNQSFWDRGFRVVLSLEQK